ncbi:hypothetical protein FISHEDRAFT_68104 [Fistulina hepatica ATCC 64428]|nr:hypothetical protein FISHEDRAFT_68104 [Fistulina hepatica ATCC 64428]
MVGAPISLFSLFLPTFCRLIAHIRSLARSLNNCMASERSRLSGATIDFVSTVASSLGSDFEPLTPTFFPSLLTLCGRPNKVFVIRARSCITNIVETTQSATLLTYFLHNIKDKSATIRLACAEGTLTCLNCCNPPDLEKEARVKEIEALMRSTARDASADVRQVGKKIFQAYKILLPDRVDGCVQPTSL